MNKKIPVELNDRTILVTGSPGFIGAALVLRLLSELRGGLVISFDNMNDYYDPALKEHRLSAIEKAARGSGAKHLFIKADLADRAALEEVFSRYRPDVVVNLAAQAGIRYSIDHPDAYISSNLIGFFNLLEACRRHPVEHLVYASSSSVYGGNEKLPFSTEDKTDRPISLYAATKKSDEVLAYSYASLFGIPCTGLGRRLSCRTLCIPDREIRGIVLDGQSFVLDAACGHGWRSGHGRAAWLMAGRGTPSR